MRARIEFSHPGDNMSNPESAVWAFGDYLLQSAFFELLKIENKGTNHSELWSACR